MEDIEDKYDDKSIKREDGFVGDTQNHAECFQEAWLLEVNNLLDFIFVLLILLVNDTPSHYVTHVVDFPLLLHLVDKFLGLVLRDLHVLFLRGAHDVLHLIVVCGVQGAKRFNRVR